MCNNKGGAVAKWSKALLQRENKRKPKRSWVRPRPGHLYKKTKGNAALNPLEHDIKPRKEVKEFETIFSLRTTVL